MNDGRLIRPTEEPLLAKIVFNWDDILIESLTRRAEIRRQKWHIKSTELELAATRNFLLPRVDAVGRYRWRGLGHNLSNAQRQAGRFDNALQDLTTGDFQEWQLGVEVSLPVGFRKAHAAVRNAELKVSRAHAILAQQERDVVHDLTAAFAELERAYATSQTSYNRRAAAYDQLRALDNKYDDADENERARLLDLLLDAQRRVADADSSYYRALLEYMLSIKNVHLQKGSLLDYNEIYLAEGAWPGMAHDDATSRQRTRVPPPEFLQRIMSMPMPVSRGMYGQRTDIGYPANPEEPELLPPAMDADASADADADAEADAGPEADPATPGEVDPPARPEKNGESLPGLLPVWQTTATKNSMRFRGRQVTTNARADAPRNRQSTADLSGTPNDLTAAPLPLPPLPPDARRTTAKATRTAAKTSLATYFDRDPPAGKEAPHH